ncbi:hypothetical protein GOP47_0010596 [Adiantum capillus-veneris]|uniref:Uncharacterized protein n=1 Tax=Adiantum capillus-veneris TaxID=13818 RepID=A0A9D4ZIY1_ADICA|nr:hypothetical protein GOP47_0010596 [Adiantum capillus-veneris]
MPMTRAAKRRLDAFEKTEEAKNRASYSRGQAYEARFCVDHRYGLSTTIVFGQISSVIVTRENLAMACKDVGQGHGMFYDVYTAWVTVDFHSPVELDMESLELQYNSCGNFQKVRGKFKKVVQ